MKGVIRIRLLWGNPRQVRKSLASVANAVAEGTFETKRANSIVVIANTILSALKIELDVMDGQLPTPVIIDDIPLCNACTRENEERGGV